MAMESVKKVAILGLGLMGGSLGLALKKTGWSGCVHGYARRAETVRYALEHGLCDQAGTSLKEAVSQADLVVVCVPVLSIPALVQEIRGFLKPGAVVTDVGSTKAVLHTELDALLHGTEFCFVGSHPIAGSEKTGAEAAYADLYEGARCLLTATASTPDSAMGLVRELWELVGCRVSVMSPEAHDRMLARTSHLPHLLSSALSMTVSRPAADAVAPSLCGPGYRDMTRLACGSPAMWKDIFESNRQNMLDEVDAIQAELGLLRGLIEREDMAGLEAYLRRASECRRSLVPDREKNDHDE